MRETGKEEVTVLVGNRRVRGPIRSGIRGCLPIGRTWIISPLGNVIWNGVENGNCSRSERKEAD